MWRDSSARTLVRPGDNASSVNFLEDLAGDNASSLKFLENMSNISNSSKFLAEKGKNDANGTCPAELSSAVANLSGNVSKSNISMVQTLSSKGSRQSFVDKSSGYSYIENEPIKHLKILDRPS